MACGSKITPAPYEKAQASDRGNSLLFPLHLKWHVAPIYRTRSMRRHSTIADIAYCLYHTRRCAYTRTYTTCTFLFLIQSLISNACHSLCRVTRGFNILCQIMVTFLSYISNACHSLSGVAERLQHTEHAAPRYSTQRMSLRFASFSGVALRLYIPYRPLSQTYTTYVWHPSRYDGTLETHTFHLQIMVTFLS